MILFLDSEKGGVNVDMGAGVNHFTHGSIKTDKAIGTVMETEFNDTIQGSAESDGIILSGGSDQVSADDGDDYISLLKSNVDQTGRIDGGNGKDWVGIVDGPPDGPASALKT